MRRLSSRVAYALRAAVSASLLLLATPALAQESGRASAAGSDSLSLNGHAYRLFGIDGLAFNQSCFVGGRPLACGVSAVRALQTLLGPAAVTCTPKGDAVAGVTPATCAGPDGDIALSLVQQGWAFADPSEASDYVAAEGTARQAKVGAWAGTFLAPAAYDQQIAAVEANYAKLAGDTARTEAEAALVAGRIYLGGLNQVVPSAVEASAAPLAEHEVQFGGFRPGFIDAASQPPAVFDWNKVAGTLEDSREEGIEAVKSSVTDVVWTELAARPSQNVDTRSSDEFYAALKSSAAKWIADGRRPVLFVRARDVPIWVRDWFAGEVPTGAKISRKAEIASSGYMGTIDGIDVYVGPGRDRAALLVPADILSGMTYQKKGDGGVLDLTVGADQAWLLYYRLGLSWLDDTVTWLTFPQMAAPTPDE